MSFTSRGSARFNWHSCTVASLKVPAMIVYDMVMNVLDTKWFPQHNIAGLISGITFVVLFSQEKPLRWKKINTYTYTHIHIHTHTHTHTLTQTHTHKFVKQIKSKQVWSELEAKHYFRRQSFQKYLRHILVFVLNSAFRKKLNFYFSWRFLVVLTKFSFWEEDKELGNNSMRFQDFSDILWFL